MQFIQLCTDSHITTTPTDTTFWIWTPILLIILIAIVLIALWWLFKDLPKI